MKVAILQDDTLDYCRSAPYSPSEAYPEYPFEDLGENNPVYGRVRDLFRMLGMDGGNFGKASWNPLGDIIKPGDAVVIKPNFVGHSNPAGSIESMITQGCIIRAALDYVHIALKGKGCITIADAPSIDTDFPRVVKATGADRIVEYYGARTGVTVSLVDMRKEYGHIRLGKLIHEALAGDPLGYTVVDLKGDSAHAEISSNYKKFRSFNYSKDVMAKHHNEDRNEYCIGNSVIRADVIINLPKLKTHNKTGFTCALKNLIGINGYKDWLPHHRAGSCEEGGDEYERRDFRKDLAMRLKDEIPDTESMPMAVLLKAASNLIYYSKLAVPFHDGFYNGCWYRNDTLPRTIADLNRIVFYADKGGAMRDTPQRKIFILVDGIVGGEKEGPQSPSEKKCGVLVAGYNPVEVDLVCSRIMGYDHAKIPMFKYAMNGSRYRIFDGDLRRIELRADRCVDFDGVYDGYNCHFIPTKGWLGHIEYSKSDAGSP